VNIRHTFLILLLPSMMLAAEVRPVPEADRYIAMAKESLERVDNYMTENGFAPLSAGTANWQAQYKADRLRKSDLIQVGTYRTPVMVWLTHASSEVVFLLKTNVFTKESPLYDQPPKPAWTREQAVKIAKGFASAAFGSFPSNVGEPHINFAMQRELPKYRDGRWTVVWPRIDDKGHQFAQDVLVVQMEEKIGPYSASKNFISNYTSPETIKVTEEMAREKASKYGKEIMEWPPAQTRFAGFKLSDPIRIEMWVVNPNNITAQQNYEDLGTAHDINARLAWVIKFNAVYSGSSEDKELPGDSKISVWIDAENGNFLGGDFN
jgi:hypothetical protein